MNQQDAFEEALGVYVGEVAVNEIRTTLDDHTPGEWLIRLTDPDGLLWHKKGWSWNTYETDTAFLFILVSEQGSGSPSIFVDAPLVLDFAKDALSGTAEQFSGGLVLKPTFGVYAGKTLTLVAWHGVMHETESGDLAPGFGGFEASVDG